MHNIHSIGILKNTSKFFNVASLYRLYGQFAHIKTKHTAPEVQHRAAMLKQTPPPTHKNPQERFNTAVIILHVWALTVHKKTLYQMQRHSCFGIFQEHKKLGNGAFIISHVKMLRARENKKRNPSQIHLKKPSQRRCIIILKNSRISKKFWFLKRQLSEK